MIYPRLSYRHIALIALYLLLISGVVGLIFMIFPFNDNELAFLFKTDLMGTRKHINNTAKYHKNQKSVHNVTNILIEPTKKYTAYLNNPVPDEIEQQHIYIDDFYTPSPKPKPIYENNDGKFQSTTVDGEDKFDSFLGNMKKIKNPNNPRAYKQVSQNERNLTYLFEKDTKINFDYDSDEYRSFQRNENVASGSGEGSSHFDSYNINDDNEVFDFETKDMIRRISRKFLKHSKKNNTTHARQIIMPEYLFGKKKKNQSKIKKNQELGVRTTSNRPVKLPTPFPSLQLSKLPTPQDNPDKWHRQIALPFWKTSQIRTRRIIVNEKKSAERSRQLLLCKKGSLGGGELCRMLFKET